SRESGNPASFARPSHWIPSYAGMTPALKPPRARLGSASLELRFLVEDVLAGDGIEFLDLHLFRHRFLVLGRGVEVPGSSRGFQFDLVTHFETPSLSAPGCRSLNRSHQTCSPRERSSARITSIPFLSIVRNAALVSLRLTQRFSLSTQNLRRCRLGMNRRLVRLLACETLLPTIGVLPVTAQTRAMSAPLADAGYPKRRIDEKLGIVA